MTKRIIREDVFCKLSCVDQSGVVQSYERDLCEAESSLENSSNIQKAKRWIRDRKKAIDKLYDLM